MENNKALLIRLSATYGLALGIIIVIYNLLLYFLNVMPIGIGLPMLLSAVSITIFFVGILYFSKRVRNEAFGGSVNFKQALLIGVLIGFFAAIITSAYSYLQNVLIDPDYLNRYINLQSEWMLNYMESKGVPDAQIDATLKTLEEAKNVQITFGTYFQSILSSTLGFAVISMITAAIIRKREKTPFEQ